MRSIITTLLIIAACGALRAQALKPTAIQCGLSTQMALHIEVRQFIGERCYLEAGLGHLPRVRAVDEPWFTHSLGINLVSDGAIRDRSGMLYSLLYSFITEKKIFRAAHDYHHAVTANIGTLYQQESGWCLVLRFGAGIIQTNSLYTYYNQNESYGGKVYAHEIHPWFNFEATIGYAF